MSTVRSEIWIYVWCGLALILVIRAGSRPAHRGVILDHLEFGRRVVAGEKLYAPFDTDKPLHPPYPPSFGLFCAPFTGVHQLLGLRAARVAWALLQMGALLMIGLFLRDLLRQHHPPLTDKLHWLLLGTLAVTLRYVLRDTHGGGGNLINVGLLLGSLLLAERGRGWPAGLLLGLSLATKPNGVLLLPWLLIRGHRRAASIGAGTGVALLALSLVLLGQGMEPFLHWFDGTVAYATQADLFAPPKHDFPPFTWMNQCLRCAVARYLGEVPEQFASQVPHFFQGLGMRDYVWVNRGLTLVLLGLTFGLAWRWRHRRPAHPWIVAAILAVSLLLSPISWKAHHVALIPAVFWILARAAAGRRWPYAFAIAYVLACGIGEALVGKRYKNLQQSLYLTTAGTLAVHGICLAGARKAARLRMPGQGG